MSTADKSLDSKVAVVTGGALGIGRGIALMLAEAGAKVYIADKEAEQAERVAQEISERGGHAVAIKTDFTNDDEVAALFKHVKEDDNKLDILIANAFNGNSLPFGSGALWELDMRSWDAMFTAGLRNHIAAIHAGAELLQKGSGGIILTGFKDSNYPEQGGNIFYDLAMNAITRLTAGVARDFEEAKIPVVALSPGLVRTEAIKKALGENPEGSQSVELCGKVVVGLLSDANLISRSGGIYSIESLAQEYGIDD